MEGVVAIKPGDFFFVRSNSFISRMVRLVETGKWKNDAPSHVAIVSSVYSDSIVLIEASMGIGIRIVNSKIYDNDTTWYKRMVEPRNIQEGLMWADKQLGISYDFPQIVGIFFRSFLRLLGKRVYNKSKTVRNLLDSKQKFICSELTEGFSEETGERLCSGDISLVTPHDQNRSNKLIDVEI